MADLEILQLRTGRELAPGDPVADQLATLTYLVSDRQAGECLLVDPVVDIDGILAASRERELRVVGVLATHDHPDHVGGALYGLRIPGVVEVVERTGVPVHVHRADADDLLSVTGLDPVHLVRHDHADRVPVGGLEVRCVHTPGHTPGSLCFLVGDNLLTGDTLFTRGCGRSDLPGGDMDELWRSLNRRLASLPGDLEVWPGHDYGDRPHASLEWLRRHNATLQVPELAIWHRLMGA